MRNAILPRCHRRVRHALERAAAALPGARHRLQGGPTALRLIPLRRAKRSRRRRACVPALTGGVRVAILAGAISAAKVVLFAVGSGSFLAVHPAEELAWVYLGLAAIAATGALALAPSLERARPVAAMTWLLLATTALVTLAAGALALALPGAPLALLILAHLYNIASEILLWLVAAAWLPAPELRRATVWIFLATALGGFVGGVAVERLLAFGDEMALLAGTAAAIIYAGLWLAASDRALGHGGAAGSPPAEDPPTVDGGPVATWGTLFAHPLGPPLGTASFMLTFVWVLTEFLCLAQYQEKVAPGELSQRLAQIYALLQLVEFACIALVAGPVTRWVPPIWRSVIFPGGALLSLLWMNRDTHGLWGVYIAHAYTESASNALFDPVHASNFAAVPMRLQARLRAVSEGVCYPLGMAAGGAVLLLAPIQSTHPEQSIMLVATIAAMLFTGVGMFTGIMIGPSLLSALGLTVETGAPATRAELHSARHALVPWARRVKLRHRLFQSLVLDATADGTRWRIDRADRRAMRQVFAQARRCAEGGPMARLEILLDSRSPERRALVVEAVLSLPLRRLFLPFQPALRRRYLP